MFLNLTTDQKKKKLNRGSEGDICARFARFSPVERL